MFYEVLTQAMFAIGRREKFVVCKVRPKTTITSVKNGQVAR